MFIKYKDGGGPRQGEFIKISHIARRAICYNILT